MNKVILIGHVGQAPEYKSIDNKTEISSFSLATTERWKSANGVKQEKTSWHNIVFFGKSAKLCKDYVSKGSKIMIEGRLQYDVLEKDGKKSYFTKIIGEKIEFLSPKNSSKQTDEISESSSNQDDDIPF